MYKAKDGSEVEYEKWQWVAEYQNGERIEQFEEDNKKFNSIRDIEMDRLARFGMVNVESGKKMIIDVDPEEMQIFHYYHNYGKLENNHLEKQGRIPVFGFKHRQSSNANYFFILDDKIVIKNNQHIKC